MADVHWNSYAHVYDLMAENNPGYQDILKRFKAEISKWILLPQSTLCDLGSGTGNFSLALASSFPHSRVLHIDADDKMNELAQNKARDGRISNIEFIIKDMETISFDAQSLSAITSVHALYPLQHPQALVARLYEWLKPGGYLFVCDLGRVLNVKDWAAYLFVESMRKHGLLGTLSLFYRGRAIAKHNRHISQFQRTGVYWTHDQSIFRKVFEQAGFEVVSCECAYRSYSDMIVCRKS